MTANLQNPIFTDETKAREWLEARVWPKGPVCPHCGSTGRDVKALNGKAHRPGVYQCNACREQFTVTVKTVFERSKLPLGKWLAALFLMTASKKGVSAHQVHRSLGISYKSAWFMCHRLREAMRSGGLLPPIGGTGKTVEADETYFGTIPKAEIMPSHGKPGRRAGIRRPAIVRYSRLWSAAARRARSISQADQNTVSAIMRHKSAIHTDESRIYNIVPWRFSNWPAPGLVDTRLS
jgi:transposase-like protein